MAAFQSVLQMSRLGHRSAIVANMLEKVSEFNLRHPSIIKALEQ